MFCCVCNSVPNRRHPVMILQNIAATFFFHLVDGGSGGQAIAHLLRRLRGNSLRQATHLYALLSERSSKPRQRDPACNKA